MKIFATIAALGAKKLAVIGVIALTITGAAVGGGIYVANSNADEAKALEDTAIVEKDGEKIRVDEDGNEVKVNKDGEVEIVEKDAVPKEEAQQATSNNKSHSSNSGNSGNHSGNSGNSNSNSNNSGGNSGGSSSGNSTPTTPTHTHNWTEVYKTVTTYTTEEVKEWGEWCSNCGANVAGTAQQHIESNYKNGCRGFYEGYKSMGTQQVPHSSQVLSHYQCSCGATK